MAEHVQQRECTFYRHPEASTTAGSEKSEASSYCTLLVLQPRTDLSGSPQIAQFHLLYIYVRLIVKPVRAHTLRATRPCRLDTQFHFLVRIFAELGTSTWRSTTPPCKASHPQEGHKQQLLTPLHPGADLALETPRPQLYFRCRMAAPAAAQQH